MKKRNHIKLVLAVGIPLIFAGCATTTMQTAADVIPAPGNSKIIPQMANEAIISDKGIVLEGGNRLSTSNTFRPPVEITIVAKTDSTNLRIAYAADQVIFNWEGDPTQLRVDGGPADGLYEAGSGGIPKGKFVTVRWLVTSGQQAMYVNNELRFKHSGNYSNLNRCVSVFPAEGSKVTVKSIMVKPLSPSHSLELATMPHPVKMEKVSANQIQKWVAQLGDSDFSKRESAVNELSRYSSEALPALAQRLKSEKDGDRRWWINCAIQECEENQPRPEEIFASPNSSNGLRVSEDCTNEDGSFTVVDRDGVRCWEVSKKGFYLYFSSSYEFRQKAVTTLAIQVEYLDIGTGTIALDYDSTDQQAAFHGAYENNPTVIHCTNSGQWRKTRFHLPNARFHGSENCQTDFRFYNGGDDMIIHSVQVWPESPIE
jgi:hypothetical protein